MVELQKMNSVLEKHFADIDVHRAITIDAVLGQNSLIQAKEFSEHISLDSAILTKMDGTAKGGIAFSLYKILNLPISFVGLGEGINDIVPFNSAEYIDAIIS
jgi:fused signal recognition particle receptor